MSKFGFFGMWRGITPAVCRAMIGSGSYFLLLEEFKFLLGSDHFISYGICSGMAKTVVTIMCTPLSVIKVRMESPTCQIYSGVYNGASQIYSTEGFRGFYRGITPSIIKEIPYSSLGYAFYEKYIEILSKMSYRDRTNPIITYLAGIFAGFTATIITQPFDVIKTKIQFEKVNEGKYTNMLLAAKNIYKEDGIGGFQRGLLPRLAKRFFSFPIVWTLYEQIKLTY